MLFNSIEFLFFLPITFLLYWFVFDKFLGGFKYKLMLQNAFIVIASYVFYGWWDWRFLLLIAFTSFCSWISGIMIHKVDTKQNVSIIQESNENNRIARKRKLITTANIIINLAILATFKYYDFFASEFAKLFNISSDGILLNVILPVGISFYTFQALSYSIDVYRCKIEPTKDIVAFFAFISFFPQLVAGPIERATNLLPQFLKKREFNYATAVDGCRQILWGLFKKIVVADNCAVIADQVFNDYANMPASLLMVGALFLTFQIYGDFSGYSDISIGTAKLFGIKLRRNFNVPYFSRNIAEFWRRWHMSLNTWFRDYIYIPLGGNRVTMVKIIRNTFIIFLLSGLWHGANWTFIAVGLYHALLFLPLILSGNRKHTQSIAEGRLLPNIKDFFKMLATFLLVTIGMIIFRAETIMDVEHYIISLLSPEIWRTSYRFFSYPTNYEWAFVLIMIVVEWQQRNKEHGLDINNSPLLFRWMLYYGIFLLIFFFGGISAPFIYFQF